MSTSRPLGASQERDDTGLAAFAQDTWNSAQWIARHGAMTPGERIELAVATSRAALQFANARPVAADER